MKYTNIPILMYHEISNQDNLWCVSPQNFLKQMMFLKQNKYKTISLTELQQGIKDQLETEEKLVVLTFDDGRNGVYEQGFPILRNFDYTATLFLVPQWIEKSSDSVPEDQSYSGFLSWEKIKEMQQAGFEIGSHTYSHANLVSLDEMGVLFELEQAEKIIWEKVGVKPQHFSYPFGKYNSQVLNQVQVRYPAAVTAKKGFLKLAGEYFRQTVFQTTSLDQFQKLLSKPTLSLCLIVKDEEKFLGLNLSSLQDLVDEMVIVDTGSIDRTKEIALQYTAKVYDFAWNDDFSVARNESLRHATGNWILILDADEMILKPDWKFIHEAINDEDVFGYSFLTRNYCNDSSLAGWRVLNLEDPFSSFAQGWFPSLKVRLFQNKGFCFRGRVHELVDEDIKEKGGQIKLLNVLVHHYGTMDRQKSKNYLELVKKKVAENPQDAHAFFELGVQYKDSGEFSLAEAAFQQSLQLDPQPKLPLLNLAIVQHKQGKIGEAVKNYQHVLASEHYKAEACFGLGFCYFKQNKFAEALNQFLSTIQYNPQHLDAYINAGALYEKEGKYPEAVLLLKEALRLSPQGRAYYNLGVVYERVLKITRAIECYEKALELNYTRQPDLAEKIKKMKKFVEESKLKGTFVE